MGALCEFLSYLCPDTSDLIIDAPDMSPRPLFTPSKHNSALPLGLAWEAQQQGAWDRDPYMREPVQVCETADWTFCLGKSCLTIIG
jgi:hypothetical protein